MSIGIKYDCNLGTYLKIVLSTFNMIFGSNICSSILGCLTFIATFLLLDFKNPIYT